MANGISGGFGGPSSSPPSPHPGPRRGGGQSLPSGGQRVILRYLGGRIGKFMVTPGENRREYFVCKGSPDILMTFAEARSIAGQSPSEFTIVAAPPANPAPASRQSPVQQSAPPGVAPTVLPPATRFPFAAAKEGLKAHKPQCSFYPRAPDWTFEGLSEIRAAGFELCGMKCCFKAEVKQAAEEEAADFHEA